jgi:hypothetical protein
MRLGAGARTATSTGPLLRAVEVDVASLDGFRAFLAREVDRNLRPAADGINADHRRGVGFGHDNVGGNVQAARRGYDESLATATANLAGFVDAAEILVDAIRRVGQNYRDADLSSAAGSAAVNRELTAAVVAARQAQWAALEAERQRRWRLRIERYEAFD